MRRGTSYPVDYKTLYFSSNFQPFFISWHTARRTNQFFFLQLTRQPVLPAGGTHSPIAKLMKGPLLNSYMSLCGPQHIGWKFLCFSFEQQAESEDPSHQLTIMCFFTMRQLDLTVLLLVLFFLKIALFWSILPSTFSAAQTITNVMMHLTSGIQEIKSVYSGLLLISQFSIAMS